MCQLLNCHSCKLQYLNKCVDVPLESDFSCINGTTISTATRCESCVVVEGTITKLNVLLYQAPFLETAGLGGIDDFQEWEQEQFKHLLVKTRKTERDWNDKIKSREERRAFCHKMSQMGFDGMPDAREAHKGFTIRLTPGNEVQIVQPTLDDVSKHPTSETSDSSLSKFGCDQE